MTLKYIFWDNDGVLVDTEGLYYEANKAALLSLGKELTEEDYCHCWFKKGKGMKLFLEQQKLFLGSEELQNIKQKRNAAYADLLKKESRLISGVDKALSQLHQRVRMGIVTNSRRDHFELIHSHTNILHYFNFVLANGDYARSKPAPDAYLKACETAGVEREHCLVIEDSERGLLAAKAAGMSCWVIPYGISSGGDFSKADKILSSVEEVPEALNGFLQ